MDQNAPLTADELRKLISPTTPGRESPAYGATPESKSAFSADELRALVQQKATPTVGFGEDFVRSAGAGLGRGVAGLPGLPGDIESLGRAGARYMGANISPEPALPTSQGVIKAAQEYIPGAKDVLSYKPEYTANRYVKAVGEFAPSALIGGPAGLGVRTAGSVGAGIATQGAEEFAKGTPIEGTGYETALKLAASIPGYMAGTKTLSAAKAPFSGLVSPGAEANRRLAESLSKDVALGGKFGAKASPTEAIETGAAVPPSALAGRGTEGLIQKASDRSSEAAQKTFSDQAKTLAGDAQGIVNKQIDNLFGGNPVLPFDRTAELARQASLTNSPAYTNLFALPNAQAVGSSVLTDVVGRLPKGTLNDVGDILRQQGIDPRSIGMVSAKGQWVINPSQPMPLQFWDSVKKSLDTAANKTKDPMTGKILNPPLYSATTENVTKLRNELDILVPEYAAVRGKAAEILGAKSAVDLGSKFLEMKNTKQVDQVYRSFLNNKNVLPEVKQEFAYGMAGAYRKMMEDAPDKAFKMFTGKDAGANIKRMNDALAPIGANAGSDLVSQVVAQNLNRSIQALQPASTASRAGQLIPYAGTGLAAVASQIGEVLAQPLIWAQTPGAIAALFATGAAGKYFNWKEARVAEKILERSINPDRMAEIAKIVADDPNARSFLSKMSNMALQYGKYPAGATISTEPRELTIRGERPQRATGGRTGGMTADKLIVAAERAKNSIGKDTEALLSTSDASVAKALAVANQKLEG